MKENNKLKKWVLDNRIVLIYAVFSILIEMISVLAVEKNPIITRPFLELGILVLLTGVILLIKKNKIRIFLCTVFLAVQAVADLGFIVVYEMTGQYFDYGMLKLRNDAFGILESIPMNFIAFYSALLFCILFIVYAKRSLRKEKIIEITKNLRIIYACLIMAGFGVTAITLYMMNSDTVDKYGKMLENKDGSNYSSLGIVGNLVNEMSKGLIFTHTEKLPAEDIDNYIYKEVTTPTQYFGNSKDKNMVVILVESFEWFSFIKSEEYPNGLDLSKEDLEYLFPNLTKFYNDSVVVDNFHSKEKTDISETISILGSYPTDAYVDYDFYNNTIPYTVPNLLKSKLDNNIQVRSFHDGFKSFYNREKTHPMFGFEYLTDAYDMYEMSDELVKSGKTKESTMYNYMDEGERNLDSEMIKTCKDSMFPKDKRFFTYITTITMHGIYYDRDNLTKYKEKLESVYTPKGNDDMEEILMNYVTTVMEFDNAVGVMMNDLESKGLLDNTTILMFGDHNSYYQQLSNYVKDIDDYDTDNYYTDLYKVPLMIYDKELGHQVIDKFTCTADIAPTLNDLLGINTYSNMFYGNSIFNDKESVLYSRAYGFFAGDGIICRSLNDMLYLSDQVSEEYHDQFNKETANLVEKIKYCDQIFYQDYFGNSKNYDIFEKKMKDINQ